jgi:hypothetical protein
MNHSQDQEHQIYKKMQAHPKFLMLSPDIQVNVNARLMRMDGGDNFKNQTYSDDPSGAISSSGAPLPPNNKESALKKKIKLLKQKLGKLLNQMKAEKSLPKLKQNKALQRELAADIRLARTHIARAEKAIDVNAGKSKHADRTAKNKQKVIDFLHGEIQDSQSILHRARGWF